VVLRRPSQGVLVEDVALAQIKRVVEGCGFGRRPDVAVLLRIGRIGCEIRIWGGWGLGQQVDLAPPGKVRDEPPPRLRRPGRRRHHVCVVLPLVFASILVLVLLRCGGGRAAGEAGGEEDPPTELGLLVHLGIHLLRELGWLGVLLGVGVGVGVGL